MLPSRLFGKKKVRPTSSNYFDLSFNYILICKKEIVKVSYDELKDELMDKFKSNRVS